MTTYDVALRDLGLVHVTGLITRNGRIAGQKGNARFHHDADTRITTIIMPNGEVWIGSEKTGPAFLFCTPFKIEYIEEPAPWPVAEIPVELLLARARCSDYDFDGVYLPVP